MNQLLLGTLCLLAMAAGAFGHGRLMDPPGRSTAWRFGFDTPKYYNDNELNCGGLRNQIMHGYKCGICGDRYQGPRRHEAGGKFARGVIVRHYQQGQDIDVWVDVTTNHLGWMEWRLCPHNDVRTPATQECLDQYVLERTDGQGVKYHVEDPLERHVKIQLKLPADVTCDQCIIQWKYHTGNAWGTNPETGKRCLGCGYQEEFYGCADIEIK